MESKDNLENIYYNLTIYGDEINPYFNKIESDITRTKPLINHPEDYLVGVERLSVSTINIPLFLWDDKEFIITLEYNDQDFTVPLQYVQTTIGTQLYGNSIYTYTQMLDILNKALLDAFNNLKTVYPTAPPTEAPYIIFNPSTKLFTLYAEQLYDSSTDTIKIYFNKELYSLFQSFPTFFSDDPSKVQILVYNQFLNSETINTKPYYKMIGSYPTLSFWFDLQNIEVRTQSIPIYPDFEPTSLNQTVQKIGDFNIVNSNITQSQVFQYFLGSNVFWKSLIVSESLQRIQLKFYWVDKRGKAREMYQSSSDPTTLKLRFKNLYSEVDEMRNATELIA
jgi:hypothetical protein